MTVTRNALQSFEVLGTQESLRDPVTDSVISQQEVQEKALQLKTGICWSSWTLVVPPSFRASLPDLRPVTWKQ